MSPYPFPYGVFRRHAPASRRRTVDPRPKARARLITLPKRDRNLDCEILHSSLELLNFISWLTLWIRVNDRGGNNRSPNATCSAKGCFAREKHIWNILLFTNA